MRALGLAAIVGLALALPAAAADAPIPPTYAPQATGIWDGAYAGVQGGWSWGSSTQVASGTSTGAFSTSGALVGGTLGLNRQMSQFVLGVEGDLSWTRITGSETIVCGAPTPCRTDINWLATARARMGYDMGALLPYLTAGVAVGGLERGFGTGSGTGTAVGWTAGGGLEAKLAGNWSSKVEYLYVDLGNHPVLIGGFSADVAAQNHILRVGFNYAFR